MWIVSLRFQASICAPLSFCQSQSVAADGRRRILGKTRVIRLLTSAATRLTVYGDKETKRWFRKAWEKTGKKLDMGKACVRFKRLEDVPPEVGQVIARTPVANYIARIESLLAQRPARVTDRSSRRKSGIRDKTTAS